MAEQVENRCNACVKQVENQSLGFALILSALDSAIIEYGIRNRETIHENIYQWFSSRLGYKSKNYIYEIITQRNHKKLGLEDIEVVLKITRNENLKQTLINEIVRATR